MKDAIATSSVIRVEREESHDLDVMCHVQWYSRGVKIGVVPASRASRGPKAGVICMEELDCRRGAKHESVQYCLEL